MKVTLTRPTDLEKAPIKVDKIIGIIEQSFLADRRFSNKRDIDISGEVAVQDRLEVCRRYKEVGWGDVTSKIFSRADGTLLTIFTFYVKKI
jgi:hypothetical protein